MKFEDSPSFDESSIQEDKPRKENKRIRVLLSAVIFILVILLGFTYLQQGLPVTVGGSGTVSGTAVNEAGQPIPVEVLVFGTDILVSSDDAGHFVVENVPAGKQSIIVAYREIGTEVEISVRANTENLIGTVTVPTQLLEMLD
jgi:hypothetical protein